MTGVKMERQDNDHFHIIYICMIPVLQTDILVYLKLNEDSFFQNSFNGVIDGVWCALLYMIPRFIRIVSI